MSLEPERPIEKLLRAYAKKRREQAGAPLELHPASRRLLQAEVAHRLGRPKNRWAAYGWLLRAFRPRYAGAFATLIVVGLIVMFWLPSVHRKPESQLANNKPELREQLAKSTVSQPTSPPTAPTLEPELTKDLPALAASKQTLQDDERAKQSTGVLKTEARDVLQKAQDSSAPARNPALALAQSERPVERQSNVGADGALLREAEPAAQSSVFMRRYALAPTSSPASASAANPSTPESGDLAFSTAVQAAPSDKRLVNLQQTVAYYFHQLPKLAPRTEPAASFSDFSGTTNLLNSFRLEQNGTKVRIIDADGSVYSGLLQVTEGGRHAMSNVIEKRAATLNLKTTPEQTRAPDAASNPSLESGLGITPGYNFSVTGTNLSLNQVVVFTGNLTAASTPNPLVQSTNNFRPGAALPVGGVQNAQPPPLSAPLMLRIAGRIRVGDAQPLDIKAEATRP